MIRSISGEITTTRTHTWCNVQNMKRIMMAEGEIWGRTHRRYESKYQHVSHLRIGDTSNRWRSNTLLLECKKFVSPLNLNNMWPCSCSSCISHIHHLQITTTRSLQGTNTVTSCQTLAFGNDISLIVEALNDSITKQTCHVVCVSYLSFSIELSGYVL